MTDKFRVAHPRQVAAILSNVAVTLADHQGVYQPALSLLREALAIRRNLIGDDSLEVAQSLTNLASVLVRNREFNQAEPLIQEAVVIRRKVLGDEHVATANTLNTLAVVLGRTGKCVDAEEAARESLDVFESNLPGFVVLKMSAAGLARWSAQTGTKRWSRLDRDGHSGTMARAET